MFHQILRVPIPCLLLAISVPVNWVEVLLPKALPNATFWIPPAHKVVAETKRMQLLLGTRSIELTPGAKAEITVRRIGGDLRALKLGLFPSRGSNLLASGGLFYADQTEAKITVEAPKGARSGSIAIRFEGATVVLEVVVKP